RSVASPNADVHPQSADRVQATASQGHVSRSPSPRRCHMTRVRSHLTLVAACGFFAFGALGACTGQMRGTGKPGTSGGSVNTGTTPNPDPDATPTAPTTPGMMPTTMMPGTTPNTTPVPGST